MFSRLKPALVRSFVGAIGVGWLFSQGILHFAYVFAAPITGWLMRREYPEQFQHANGPVGFSLQDALPELVRSCALLLIAYLLLRWLYFRPLEPESTQSASEVDLESDAN